MVAIATINCYLIIYDEKKSNQIEVSEVWDRVRSAFWPYLGTSVLFFILFIIAYIILLIPVFILADISGVLLFFGIFFIVGGIIYLVFSSSLTYFIQLYEKKNFIDALVRSMRLIRGKWWSTFGLIFILYLIMMTVSYVFIIPYYAVLFTNTLHSASSGTALEFSSGFKIWTIVFFTFYYMAQMLMSSLPNVGIAFQYFNLVELKEAKGLMNQIENLGQSSAPDNRPEEHY